MADSSTVALQVNIDQLSSKVQNSLRSWRELLVKSEPIFLWTESHHAGLLAGAVTAAFLLIWLLDATILTTFSVIGIIVTVADYVVPLLSAKLIDPTTWNDKSEQKYNEICVEIAKAWALVLGFWSSWQAIKVTSPKLYFGLLLSALVTLAWIGNLFNNLLLTYLLSLLAVEYPGLKHHGLIEKHLGSIYATISTAVGDKLKQN
jgi:hypothetical protein